MLHVFYGNFDRKNVIINQIHCLHVALYFSLYNLCTLISTHIPMADILVSL